MTTVVSVIATVRLRPAWEKRAMREYWRHRRDTFDGPDWLIEDVLDESRDAEQLELSVALSAFDDTGRRTDAEGTFGIAGQRRGVSAIWHRYRGPQLSEDPAEHERLLHETYRVGPSDIEDAINQMLGRDPDQHRPPRLAWRPLIAALAAEGIQTDEDELIQLPLIVELDDAVVAELKAP